MPSYEKEKNMCIAYVFWFFLGVFGGHRFYLERWCTAVLWLLTGGLLGVGWLVDLCVIPCLVNSHNSIVYRIKANTTMSAASGTASVAGSGQSQVLNISVGDFSTYAPQV